MQANTPYSAQVYKDPVFACTMASKAAWAELARKRCTLLKSSPGSPQHGSWFCGKRDWTFQRHARLLTTKGLHRFQRKDVWKLLQTPSSKAKTHHDNTNENPFMSKWIRGCTLTSEGRCGRLAAPTISVRQVQSWLFNAGTIAPKINENSSE